MKKKTIKKGRLSTYVTIALAGVSLVAVGFSAWVIQNVDTKEVGDVTIQVAGTDNQSVTFQDVTMIDDTFVLDAELGDVTAPIVIDDGNSVGEDLHLSYSFSFEKSKAAAFKGVSYRLVDKTTDSSLKTYLEANEDLVVFPGQFTALDETGSTYFPLVPHDAISSAGEIVTSTYYFKVNKTSWVLRDGTNHNLKVSLSETSTGSGEDLVNLIKVTVDAYLEWGSKFDGVNPSRYGEGASATLDSNFATAQAVVDTLNTLKENINSKKFAFEISHIPTHTVTLS